MMAKQPKKSLEEKEGFVERRFVSFPPIALTVMARPHWQLRWRRIGSTNFSRLLFFRKEVLGEPF